jgi:hypothetical protein
VLAVAKRESTTGGKWRDPAVPKRGWQIVGMHDNGPEEDGGWTTCEMCETRDIRYVHTMEHSDYHETLDCGCVCAGHMEEAPETARAREREFKNKVSRTARAARKAAEAIEAARRAMEAGALARSREVETLRQLAAGKARAVEWEETPKGHRRARFPYLGIEVVVCRWPDGAEFAYGGMVDTGDGADWVQRTPHKGVVVRRVAQRALDKLQAAKRLPARG